MNHCMLMAEIISAPQLRYTQDNQTAIAEMMVAFPGIKADDAPQQLKVIGWGNLAQDIQERYQTGDRVLIEGRLSMNTVDRPEGFKEKLAELTAQRIHRLAELGSVAIPQPVAASDTPAAAAPQPSYTAPPSQPTAASTPAAPETEPDYDDIPF